MPSRDLRRTGTGFGDILPGVVGPRRHSTWAPRWLVRAYLPALFPCSFRGMSRKGLRLPTLAIVLVSVGCMNGAEIGDVAVSAADPVAPAFNRHSIGWRQYHEPVGIAHDIWFDEVALHTSRIGCDR